MALNIPYGILKPHRQKTQKKSTPNTSDFLSDVIFLQTSNLIDLQALIDVFIPHVERYLLLNHFQIVSFANCNVVFVLCHILNFSTHITTNTK